MTAPRPGARPKAPDGAALAFCVAASLCEQSACIEWPYGKSEGYGMLWWDGRKVGAHALVLGAWLEQPPETEACHTCDNRGCINHFHLYWGTRQDNVNDMMARRGHWSTQ